MEKLMEKNHLALLKNMLSESIFLRTNFGADGILWNKFSLQAEQVFSGNHC